MVVFFSATLKLLLKAVFTVFVRLSFSLYVEVGLKVSLNQIHNTWLLIPATVCVFHKTILSAYRASSDFKTLGSSFIKIKYMEQVEDEPCGSPSAKIFYADKGIITLV